MKKLAGLILAFLVCIGFNANADDISDRATSMAQVLIEHMKVFDSEGEAQMFNTKMFEKTGKDPKVWLQYLAGENERLKLVGAINRKFELSPAGWSFSEAGQLYAILPYSRVLEIKNHQMLIEAYLIGESGDRGNTWKFLNASSGCDAEVVRKKLMPGYDGPLPSCRSKQLK